MADTTTSLQALRFNQGKVKLSLLLSAPDALKGVARVMEFGAKKYGRDNWMKGLPYTEVLDSGLRHLLAFSNGEELDPESELPHIDHALCNILFLGQFMRTRPEFDDRILHVRDKVEP